MPAASTGSTVDGGVLLDLLEQQHRRAIDVRVVQAERGPPEVEPVRAPQGQHAAARAPGLHEHDLLDAIRLDVRVAALEPALQVVAEAGAEQRLAEFAHPLDELVVLARRRATRAGGGLDGARERVHHRVPRGAHGGWLAGECARGADGGERDGERVVLPVAGAPALDHQRGQRRGEQRIDRRIGERHAPGHERLRGRRRQRARVGAARRRRAQHHEQGDHADHGGGEQPGEHGHHGRAGYRGRSERRVRRGHGREVAGVGRRAARDRERGDAHHVIGWGGAQRRRVAGEGGVEQVPLEPAAREATRDRIGHSERAARGVLVGIGDPHGEGAAHVSTGQQVTFA